MNLKSFVIYSFLSFALTGCLLEQKEPKPSSVTNAPWVGIVSVEDIDAGERKTAGANAFFLTADNKQAPSRAAAMAERLRGSDEPMKCESKVTPDESNKSSIPEGKRRLSVGRLFFGPALQTSLQVFFQDGASVYRLPLEPGLNPGAYQILAEGGRDAAGFSDVISIPEALSDVKVNSADVHEPGSVLKRSDDLALRWKAPTTVNDQNIIFIDFISRNDTSRGGIHCVGLEAALKQGGGEVEWTISKNLIAEFPVDVTAQLHVVRAHLRRSRAQNAEVQLQGLRTSFSMHDFVP